MAKIEVHGKIHLGRECELNQRAEKTATRSSFFDIGRPIGMPSADYIPQRSPAGELPLEKLVHTLNETDNNLFIDGAGLVTSYGIFGAPGSGKTYLLTYLLNQLLHLNSDQSDSKYGALILDPKATLIDDVLKIVSEIGRDEDLIILNTDWLIDRPDQWVNVINTDLDPYELGRYLVLAAQGGGAGTSDPYWVLAWGNIFGAALYLLSTGNDVVTIQMLLDQVLSFEDSEKTERKIQHYARQKRAELETLDSNERRDIENAIIQIDNFFSQKNDSISTIEALIFNAYSQFQRSRYDCYSRRQSKALAKRQLNFYDKIIEEGKIILVSLSPGEPIVAKTLCTLVKCLFQRSVLSRESRWRAKKLMNFQRPLLLACDEYSQVATEVPGQPIGDGDFFSLARQNGCMGLIATQSVNVLQATSLKENWRSIFSTFSAKIFMRSVDNETSEEATKLAGETDWYITSQGTSQSKDGLSFSTQKDLRERKTLPSYILTQVFQRGDAVVIGSLDGAKTQSFVRFMHVPEKPASPKDLLQS
jgi:hypothetical protein